MNKSQQIIEAGRAAALLLEDPTISALLTEADARCWEATLTAKSDEARHNSISLALAYRSIRGELLAATQAAKIEQKRLEGQAQ